MKTKYITKEKAKQLIEDGAIFWGQAQKPTNSFRYYLPLPGQNDYSNQIHHNTAKSLGLIE